MASKDRPGAGALEGLALGLLLWRVQLRRGFVKHNDKDVSTTAVIGVEFKTAQIDGKRG